MSRILVTLLFIVFVVGINGVWLKPLTSIDEDAVGIAQLIEKLWSLKPAILKHVRPLIYCQIIDRCCEDEDRLKAVSLISQFLEGTNRYQFAEVIKTCVNSTASNKTNQLCSSILTSIAPIASTYRNSDVKKYFNVISHDKNILPKFFDQSTSTCSSEEIYAFLCSTNQKLVEICTGKILQKIYDGDKNYQVIMLNTKQVLTDLNQQLSQAFKKNKNTD